MAAPSRLRFSTAVVLVAVVAALFAVGFRLALNGLVHAFSGEHDIVSAIRRVPVGLRILLPAAGGLAAGLFGRLAKKGGGHGVGDVMEAVVLGRVKLSIRNTIVKCIGSFFALATGNSVGREGPLIRFGGASGSFIGEKLGLGTDQTRLLIAAGTAAGFAAAYNTPFAAVLFVIEVVTNFVVLDATLPALVATVIATTIARAAAGPGPIYGSRAFAFGPPGELLLFVGLAVAAAVVSQGFMRLLALGEIAFRKISLPWRSALGGLATGGILCVLPEVAGNGAEPLNAMLDGRLAVGFVALLIVGKAVATTTSVSSGNPGGVFTPSLAIGGAVGIVYAWAAQKLGLHPAAAGGYALVGMAAATAATTHAPLMAAVMVFELSGDYSIVLPLVISTALATLISRRLRADSIYTAELRERGIDWPTTSLPGTASPDARTGSPA
ncbi:MAG: chloride channel protein [Polyangia bacterium]